MKKIILFLGNLPSKLINKSGSIFALLKVTSLRFPMSKGLTLLLQFPLRVALI